jgi:hypothetical protein
VRGKLADSHPEAIAARNSVIEALKFGVPSRLAETDAALLASTLKRESEKLRHQFAIDPLFAQGAVKAWAMALDLPLQTLSDPSWGLSADGKAEIGGFQLRPERMVRCAEGHVFDVSLGRCPVCGWTKPQDQRGGWSMSLRELVFSDRLGSGRAGPVRLLSRPLTVAAAGAVAILVAVVVYLYARPPAPGPFNAGDPLTWPVGAGQAALLPGPACGRGWLSTPVGCLKSARDVGRLSIIANYSLPSNLALFFAVAAKSGICPQGTAFETPEYCLTEAPLPGETTVNLVSNPDLLNKTSHLHCNPFSELDTPLQGYCLVLPKSPALRGPWHLVHTTPVDNPFGIYPSVLRIEGPKLLCPDNALLQNDVGFCLVAS